MEFQVRLHHDIDTWHPRKTLADMTQTVQQAAQFGRGRPWPHQLVCYSAMERDLTEASHNATTDAARAQARSASPAAKENSPARAHARQHHGNNGLAAMLAEVPYMKDGDTKIYETSQIAGHATEHYKHIPKDMPEVDPQSGVHTISEAEVQVKLQGPQEDYTFRHERRQSRFGLPPMPQGQILRPRHVAGRSMDGGLCREATLARSNGMGMEHVVAKHAGEHLQCGATHTMRADPPHDATTQQAPCNTHAHAPNTTRSAHAPHAHSNDDDNRGSTL